jgi:hypothetical protein
LTLETGAVVIITVTAAVYDDGSYWRAAPDAMDRVTAMAARLTGVPEPSPVPPGL